MILPLKDNVLRKVLRWTSDGDSSTDTGSRDKPDDTEVTEDLNEADLVTSQQRKLTLTFGDDFLNPGSEQMHTPVLDIDVPAVLVPSTTPGHSHLYINASMSWGTYVRLLDAMADAGILEPGYVAASMARGFTAVRLPWVRKS